MKKQFMFLLLFMFLGSLLIGQSSPIIVVSTTGKVTYTNSAKSKMKISSGAVLSQNGFVTLDSKAAAIVYCNGEYKKLKAGKNQMKNLCSSSNNMRSLNIDAKIGDFMVSAAQLAYYAAGHNSGWDNLTNSKNAAGDGWGEGGKDGWGEGGKDGWGEGGKDGWGEGGKDGWGEGGKDGWGEGGKDGWGEGGKDGWGEGGKDGWGEGGKDGWGEGGKDGWGEGGKDGWGGNGRKIYLILPMGKVENTTVRFWWSKPANTNSYKVEILDQTKKIIHSVTVKDTFANIDLRKLVINHEEQYSWRVSSMEDAGIISKPYKFAIEEKTAKKASMSKLSKSKIYKDADPVTRSLMEAVVLEQDDWYYDASQLYAKLDEKNPNHNLVKMMHAAFWMRSGLNLLADAVVMP